MFLIITLARQLTLSSAKMLGLRSSTDTAIESPERNDLLVLPYVSEVTVGLGQFQACENGSGQPLKTSSHASIGLASESSGNFPHVLKMSTKVFPSRTGG